jgi:hypothetical protein
VLAGAANVRATEDVDDHWPFARQGPGRRGS